MPIEQKIIALFVALCIAFVVVRLVYKRRLRENYSWLWMLISFLLIIFVVKYEWLVLFAGLIKTTPISLLFFCGIIALLLLVLQLAVMNSSQAETIKDLSQKIAILENAIKRKEN